MAREASKGFTLIRAGEDETQSSFGEKKGVDVAIHWPKASRGDHILSDQTKV